MGKRGEGREEEAPQIFWPITAPVGTRPPTSLIGRCSAAWQVRGGDIHVHVRLPPHLRLRGVHGVPVVRARLQGVLRDDETVSAADRHRRHDGRVPHRHARIPQHTRAAGRRQQRPHRLQIPTAQHAPFLQQRRRYCAEFYNIILIRYDTIRDAVLRAPKS